MLTGEKKLGAKKSQEGEEEPNSPVNVNPRIPPPSRPGHSGAFASPLFDERKGPQVSGTLTSFARHPRTAGEWTTGEWTGSRIASPARWRLLAMKRKPGKKVRVVSS